MKFFQQLKDCGDTQDGLFFVVLHQSESKPYLKDGAIEASLTGIKYANPAHADFWRIHPDGFFLSAKRISRRLS